MTSLKTFSGKRSTISEHSNRFFFLESVFAEVRNSGLQGCRL